jgi:hypothetical protein
MQTTKKLGFQSRAAKVAANSYNEADNTIEVVFATETPVTRSTWEGNYNEVLSMDAAHVLMERINAGAPVLNNHRSYGGVDTQLGKVERAWIEGGVAKAVLRFSKRADVQPIIQDIKDGIISSVSVGYRVYKYEEKAAPEPQASPNGNSRADTTPTFIATKWEPFEISMVSIPADTKAGVRADGDTQNDVIIISQENIERKMETPTPNPAPVALTEEQLRAAQETATKAERARVADIQLATRKAGLGEEFANEHITAGTAIDAFRAAAFDAMEKKNANVGAPNLGAPESRVTGKDEVEKRHDAIQAAIMLRSGATKEADVDKDVLAGARQYRHARLMDIAKDSLIRGGENAAVVNAYSPLELVGRAITSNSSDFAIILEGTNRRILLEAYRNTPDTWRQFCAVGSVSDFREYKRLRTGTLSDLEVLRENGEYRMKRITDADYEKVSVTTKGNMINISREMIINDDLNAFVRLTTELGRAAKRSIENDVYASLLANSGNGPLLVDGKSIFHADHNNIATAGVLSETTLDAARILMGLQKDKDSNDFLDFNPSILVINRAQGNIARRLNNAQYSLDPDAANQTPNLVNGLFNTIVDSPRIPTDAQFYMFCDPAIEAVLEVNFLNGQQEPYMESREGWYQDGLEWKVRLDWGVNPVGFRGAVKVPKV